MACLLSRVCCALRPRDLHAGAANELRWIGPVIEPSGIGPVIEPHGIGPVIEPSGIGPVIEPNGRYVVASARIEPVVG